MEIPHIIRLDPTIQHYAWGRSGEQSLVARLAGLADSAKPCAELWYGAHTNGPATAHVGATHKVRLDELIEKRKQHALGTRVYREYGATLPFLLKLLSIARPLSLQAHPDRQTALQLHARDAAHYPDRNHKPELAVALSPGAMLYGFRPVAELRALMGRHPGLGEIFGTSVLAADQASDAHVLRAAHVHALQTRSDVRVRVAEQLAQGASRDDADMSLFAQLLSEFGAADKGIFVALLMNHVRLVPGDSVFIPPGVMHAYLAGDLLECMANSDNVVRAGLTTKFQDEEALVALVNYQVGGPKLRHHPEFPAAAEGRLSVMHFEAAADEFALQLLCGQNEIWNGVTDGSPLIIVCLEGRARVQCADEMLELAPGGSAFIPAATPSFSLQLTRAKVACASVPMSRGNPPRAAPES